MKVIVFDSDGDPIGIAWHENNYGYVELPPATRACVATHFSVNDGPLQELTYRVQVPVDEVLRLRVRDLAAKAKPPEDYFERLMREAFRGATDETAPAPTGWWDRLKRWFA